MLVRPLPELARALHDSEGRQLVRALQELWVEHGALGDCSATAEDLSAVLVAEIGAQDTVTALETGALETDDAVTEQGDSASLIQNKQHGDRKRHNKSENGLESIDAESFTERAEELLALLLNEQRRERLYRHLGEARQQTLQKDLWERSDNVHETHCVSSGFFSSVLALYTGTLLRSERAKARLLGCLLLSRLPLRTATQTLTLDEGRLVAILLREHGFLRRAAVRSLGLLLQRLTETLPKATNSSEGYMEEIDAAWMQRLRRDRGFMRTLGTLFRALVMLLEDTDDAVFAEAFCALLRLCRGRSVVTEPEPSPVGLLCFEILDDSGEALMDRFHRVKDAELKSAILKEMPALVALSLRRHEKTPSEPELDPEQKAVPFRSEKTRQRERASAALGHEKDMWALSFLREFCIPMLRTERSLVRLQDESSIVNESSERASSTEKPNESQQTGERSDSIWRASVAFLLELACICRSSNAQNVLRSAIPSLQLALTQRELSSGIGTYLFRRLLVAAMHLLSSTEDQYTFLSQQLELWPRLPRSCQTCGNLFLLISLIMECSYQLPARREAATADPFVSTMATVEVSSVCRSLFPPLRRNLLDTHMVRETDWNRLRDSLFCAMVVVSAKLRSLLCELSSTRQPSNTPDNAASREESLRARCHELTVSLQFISNFREYLFRYHGLSARYGDLMAALICLVLEAVFYTRDVSLSLQQLAIGFIAETLRDCATHVASPTALKIFSRGICRALPLLPPFDAENELYEMLAVFLERAIPRAIALPAQRRSWRSSTGLLRFETPSLLQHSEYPTGNVSASNKQSARAAYDPLLGALLEDGTRSRTGSRRAGNNGSGSTNHMDIRSRTERASYIPDLLVDSDADTHGDEANRADERAVPLRKLVSEAAPLLYESRSGAEYAEFVRRSNLELIGSLFEMQKRFPGANSRALRTYVQLAVMQIALLAESPSRAFRDDVFLDVAATADSQLRFLRIGEYATPESRDALLRRVAAKDDAQLGAFTILSQGKSRPLVAAHVTDALVETIRALLLHEHLLMDCIVVGRHQQIERSNFVALGALWRERHPSGSALSKYFLGLVWPASAADLSRSALGETVTLGDVNGPLQIRANLELDRSLGILWLHLDVQYPEGICGFADIRVGFEGDDDSSSSDESEAEFAAENPSPPTDSGWLVLPDQYTNRIFLRQTSRLRLPLPLRRGVYFVRPIRIRVWWRPCDSESTMFSSDPAGDLGESTQVADDHAARAEAAASVWACTSAAQLSVANIPVEPLWLLLLCPLAIDSISLDFCHGLWDRCPARRGVVMAPTDAALPAIASSYLWVQHLLRFLERTFFLVTVAKAPDMEPRHAVLYGRSRFHGHGIVIRLSVPFETETGTRGGLRESALNKKPWVLLHMRSDDALFLEVFCSHLERVLRQWNIPLDYREENEMPLTN
jgi:hypothetical protein